MLLEIWQACQTPSVPMATTSTAPSKKVLRPVSQLLSRWTKVHSALSVTCLSMETERARQR